MENKPDIKNAGNSENLAEHKYIAKSSPTVEKLIFKILSLCVAILLALIVSGTIIAFATGKAKPGSGMRNIDPLPQRIAEKAADISFTEYERLRTLTKPADLNSNGSPVIISPWISYKSGDKSFYEELTQKNRKIQTIITDYFASHTKQELLNLKENTIKAEILQNINKELVLGKIQAIYFKEYIFLD